MGEEPENGDDINTKNSSSSGKLFSKTQNYKGATFRTQSVENKKEGSLLTGLVPQANDEGYEGGNSGSNSGPSANNNN